jgi:hypothetical protein
MSPRRIRLTDAVAGALAVTAVAAPAAGAIPAEELLNDSSRGSDAAGALESKAPAPTVTRTIDEGFDWGSAAIGAGGAAAALLLSAAGASAVSRRHNRIDAPAATAQPAVDPPTNYTGGGM